jgi:hypothetical protein
MLLELLEMVSWKSSLEERSVGERWKGERLEEVEDFPIISTWDRSCLFCSA